MTTGIRLASEDFWAATVVATIADLLLIVLLLWFARPLLLRDLRLALAVTSGVLWGGFGCILVWGFWDLYYRFIFPDWVRSAVPLNVILYGAIGLVLWWLTGRIGGTPALTFPLLGGLAGVLEHIAGIAWLGVLGRVPMLNGVSPVPVLVFAFAEYVFYWGVVLGVTLIVERTGIVRRRGRHPLSKPG